jgi:hypothetical protein
MPRRWQWGRYAIGSKTGPRYCCDAIWVGEELKCISCTPAAQSSYIYPLTRKSQVLFYQTIQPGYDVLNKLTVA